MIPAVFCVSVTCKANNLKGSVEVIALTSSGAKALAKRVFFKGEGWEVFDCKKIRDLRSSQ